MFRRLRGQRGGGERSIRMIHINDCYTLENMPRVKSLVAAERAAAALEGRRVFVSMGGDFLAPYLLSTLDHGLGMVDVLNSIGTTHAILGNHEADVPHEELVARASEFGGVWLNSNFQKLGAGEMPRYDVIELSGGVTVGLVGVLCGYAHLYREASFDGKAGEIEDPAACVVELLESKELSRCDVVVALTHLDLPDDLALARKCAGTKLVAVLGGHDHRVVETREAGVVVVKAGMNATKCAIVDIEATGRCETRLLDVAEFPEDAETRRLVDRHMVKVKALDKMILASVEELETQLFTGPCRLAGPLTSQHARRGECSVATMLCSVLKWELDCDCAVLDGGSVRAAATYDDVFTFAHLKAELPFVNATGIAAIDGATLRAMIAESRSNEGAQFLHVDVGCGFDDDARTLATVDGGDLVDDRVYSVAVGLDLGFGSKVNETMIAYAARRPDRVPSLEAAIPAKNIILAFFAHRFWRRLPVFDALKQRDSDFLTYDDLYPAFAKAFLPDPRRLAPDDALAAEEMVRQLIVAADKNGDGRISRQEYEAMFCRHAKRRSYSGCAVRRDKSCRSFYLRKEASLLDDPDISPP